MVRSLSLRTMKDIQFAKGREEPNWHYGRKQCKQLSLVLPFQRLQRLSARYLLVKKQISAWLDWKKTSLMTFL